MLASLSAKRRTFDKLYLSMSEKSEEKISSPKIEQITKMASNQGIQIKYLHKVMLILLRLQIAYFKVFRSKWRHSQRANLIRMQSSKLPN